MSGTFPMFSHGPVTYKATEVIRSGRVVKADGPNGGVKEAEPGDKLTLGVALTNAAPRSAQVTEDNFGNPVVSAVLIPEEVTAGYGYFLMTYGDAAGFGVLVKVGPNGTVVPLELADDAALSVGYCAAPNGVAAGKTGLVHVTPR